MLGFLITLGVLWCLLWIGFNLTGALLSACVWLFISVPLGAIACGMGIVCCLTIILIPVGLWLLKAGFRLMIPGI